MYTLDLDSLSVDSFSMGSVQADGEESVVTPILTVNVCVPVATYLLGCREEDQNA